ncbi:MAG TPA: Fur family transcriptional regulator [Anaerolineales bacterium]|nr:Fur family transcriptional regulator [Anaerolineales bacterium]
MKTLFNKPGLTGVDEVGTQLQQSGYRLTRPRKAVIRALTEANDWLRPEDLLALARRYWRPLGLVTVYRTVSLLAELGYLRRVHLEDRCVGYVRAEFVHGHHLLCRTCHQAVEFPGTEDLSLLMERISQDTGFQVEHHLLELVGLCPNCQ